KQVSGLGLEDALDRRPYPDIFSAPATLLHAMMLALDNPPAHLPSHSSTNLLLHTTLPFTDKPRSPHNPSAVFPPRSPSNSLMETLPQRETSLIA
ncbi:hypothetical protein C0989_011884, partial [Termitomyces sp. Mn162]